MAQNHGMEAMRRDIEPDSGFRSVQTLSSEHLYFRISLGQTFRHDGAVDHGKLLQLAVRHREFKHERRRPGL